MATGYERFLQHPATVMGATMMSASDPDRQGLGGVGRGILAAGDAVNYQRAFDERMKRSEVLRSLQELELRRAQLDEMLSERQRAAQARWLAGVGPQDKAMAEAYPELYAQSRMREPKLTTAQRNYEAAIAQGYQGTLMDFMEETRPPGTTVNIGDKPESTGEAGSRALVEQSMRAGQQLKAMLTNPDGSVNRMALAQAQMPGTPANRLLNILVDNQVYMKSGAAATAQERATARASILPHLISGALQDNPLAGIDEALDFAQSRLPQAKRVNEPGDPGEIGRVERPDKGAIDMGDGVTGRWK